MDLIAVLALAGTIAVGQYLAGSLIALMLATGRALDAAAEHRASRDLRSLLERVPRSVRRRTGTAVEVVPLSSIRPGDVVVIGPGEVVPVDGRAAAGPVSLDESALTGESALVERAEGDVIRSGVVNAGPAAEIAAVAGARDSTYAQIVRLARQAAERRAPAVRLAERYAMWFLPLSLCMAAAAWLLSGSAERAVAVLVVATPCPLLLAVPVAVVSGLSQAARRGVIVRDGGALERLGRCRTLVLDKTGTLTSGRPRVLQVATAPGWTPTQVLRDAASLEQMSSHVLAQAIVREANARGLVLHPAQDVDEEPGQGVRGIADGRSLSVGKAPVPLVESPSWARSAQNRALLDGAAVVWLAADDLPVGAILLRDPLRQDAPRTLRRLRAAGLTRLLMLTGDRTEPAREVAAVVGLDGVRAEQLPADKVAAVREESTRALTVMVGDGLNDAPALAAADVGVAMGAHGSTASSEAADVVLTTDRVDRVADAMEIAVRVRRIAVQSAAGGMSLSLVAMIVALLGWLPPAPGALLQEAIDVVVIVNALRARLPGRGALPSLAPNTEGLIRRFAAEQVDLAGVVDAIRDAAGLLSSGDGAQALEAVRRVDRMLSERLLPHEHAEERELYPALADPLGGPEATATMSRAHTEIGLLARRISNHLALADRDGGLGRV